MCMDTGFTKNGFLLLVKQGGLSLAYQGVSVRVKYVNNRYMYLNLVHLFNNSVN
jgi:hypothetical protein